jgi:hypothetical protein
MSPSYTIGDFGREAIMRQDGPRVELHVRSNRIDQDLLLAFRRPANLCLTLASWVKRHTWDIPTAQTAWRSLASQQLIISTPSGWVLTAAGRDRLEVARV